MCGILGILKSTHADGNDRERLAVSLAAQRHRGPDGEGFYRDELVQLGMCRLAIIGLTNGQQPFFNEDRTVTAVVNGEIYNHRELRQDLTSRGHCFQGGSDCETLVHLYEEHGPDFPGEVAGMFAAALWDRPKKRLLLARDRLGEKPLYLSVRKDGIFFASEIRALLRLLGGLPEPDLSAWAEFLLFEYIHDSRTPFQGIAKLEPGTVRIFEGANLQERRHVYWNFPLRTPVEGARPEDDIGSCLQVASRQILRSERPVAVALSGGLDSGLVLALAARAREGGQALRAITVGYPGKPEMDERDPAQRLARDFGIPHHTVELSEDAVVRDFPDLINDSDDLLADIAAPGYRALAKASHELGSPVLLMGQGGDELFWGYRWVRESAQGLGIADGSAPAEELRRIPWTRRLLARWEQRGFFPYRGSEEVARALRVLSQVGGRFNVRKLRHQAARQWDHAELPAGLRVTQLIARSYLLANGLPLADRLGMAHSVEARQLFLDHRLWETVLGHRQKSPDFFLPPKAWLKSWARLHLPSWWLDLPKRGFAPPAQQWKRAVTANYAPLLERGWWEESGLVPRSWIRKVVKLAAHKARHADMAYKLLVGEMWMRNLRKSPA